MLSAKKALIIGLPIVLVIAIASVFAYGTSAAYYKAITQSSTSLTSKSIVFFVNGSSAQTVQLPAMTVAPNGSASWTVTLDARGSEVPLNASFVLNMSNTGSWPPGLNVTVNGTKITPGTAYTLNYAKIHSNSPKTVTITYAWDTSTNAGYCRTNGIGYLIDRFLLGKPVPEDFDGFSSAATATVVATQIPD